MSDSEPRSIIRIQCGLADSHLISAAELFDQAFAQKFKPAIPDDQLRSKFWARILNGDQLITAFKRDELVGIALLTFSESPGFVKAAARQLFRTLGLVRGLRAAMYFLLYSKLDTRIGKDTIYLEALSVSKDHRGTGIGSLLIDDIKQLASAQGFSRLHLKVTLENERARNLYESIGFTVMSTTRSPLLKAFTGVGGAHLMEWTVPSPEED